MNNLDKYLSTIGSDSALARETRRLAAPSILREAGVEFTEHNEGAHLRVVVSGTKVTDFWPGTDTWRKLGGGRRSGIDKLIEYIRKFKEAEAAARQQRVCGACNGSGRMVRDPDIGTDQECFACGGSGEVEEVEDGR